MRRIAPILALLLLVCAGCRSLPRHAELGAVDRESATAHLAQARAEVDAGELATAVERLVQLRAVKRLPPDQRLAIEELLVAASSQRLEELESASPGSDDYLRLYRTDLAPPLKARAGLEAANRMLEAGRALDAFKQVKDVERRVPGAVDRVLAGDIVGRAGLELIERRGRYFLLFRYSSRGQEALEYLVLRYPFDPRCPQAYVALVDHYQRRREFELSIERAEDLVIYHPDDPLAVRMQARLPQLRLARLDRDDFDRRELLQAQTELDVWLERHAGRPSGAQDEASAREALRDAQRRLAENDLSVARYYDRIDEAQAVRLHAERALESARDAGDEETAVEAQRLIARWPAASAPAVDATP